MGTSCGKINSFYLSIESYTLFLIVSNFFAESA